MSEWIILIHPNQGFVMRYLLIDQHGNELLLNQTVRTTRGEQMTLLNYRAPSSDASHPGCITLQDALGAKHTYPPGQIGARIIHDRAHERLTQDEARLIAEQYQHLEVRYKGQRWILFDTAAQRELSFPHTPD